MPAKVYPWYENPENENEKVLNRLCQICKSFSSPFSLAVILALLERPEWCIAVFLHFTFLRYFALSWLLNILERSARPRGHSCFMELLNFSRGNSRSPASKAIINVKELCAIPASNTLKTGNEIDQLSSFTATGMTNVLRGDYIEEITGNQ